ncbi:T9SS type A sorting domain-containing protein [bacterium]|nr:T9SS type A sorting domain-containing protein [bacterium]
MNTARWSVTVLLVLASGDALPAAVHHVPEQYNTIQTAIDASLTGDTVLVAPGNYGENINFNGRLITVGSHFLTTGDSSFVLQTSIDGNQDGSTVAFNHQEDSTALLTGFTITNGSALRGGGIYCLVSGPTLRRLILSGNQAESGGGIACLSASPRLEQVVIQNNIATEGGGGFYLTGPISAPLFAEVILRGNQALNGGGLQIHNSSPNLAGLIVQENSADQGGGIHCYLAQTQLQLSQVIGNSAAAGAGIYCLGSELTLDHLTIADNEALWGGGISFDDISSANILNTILRNNYLSEIVDPGGNCSISWSSVFGGWPGENNQDGNPLFCDPANALFTLAQNSPCLGAGQNGSDIGALPADCDPITDSWNGPLWQVATTGSDAVGDGSPDNPLRTIQYGIVNTNAADTVLVYPGTYTENIDFQGRGITVGSLYLLTEDTSYIAATIIDGGSRGTVVTCVNAEDTASHLCGFQVSGGLGQEGGGVNCYGSSPRLSRLIITGNVGNLGGGISCRHGASPVMEAITIRDNSSSWWGGGVYCGESSGPLLHQVEISGNHAVFGGGVACWELAAPELVDVLLRENSAVYAGGGLYSGNHAAPDLTRVTAWRNQAGTDGGGLFISSSELQLTQLALLENSAGGNGGGLACHQEVSLTLDQVTITGNQAASGGGFSGEDSVVVTFQNTILWDNLPQQIYFNPSGTMSEATVVCSDAAGGLEAIEHNDNCLIHWLEDNLDLNPLFCGPAVADFRLQEESPCRTSSCGYMGYTGESCDGETIAAVRHPAGVELRPTYPNPFNPTTTIEFTLPYPRELQLTVYNILGQPVRVLAAGSYTAGRYRVMFDATDGAGFNSSHSSPLASGVYIYRLVAGDQVMTRKMVLVQ